MADKGAFYIIGTPIGNLSEITLRALEVLKTLDLLICEDTRRSLKLLNAYDLKIPLRSCPHYKEKSEIPHLLEQLRLGKKIGFVSDAGMPGVNDPGAHLVYAAREKGYRVEIVGGVSALTSFLGGLGHNLENFIYMGFLPPRLKDRNKTLSSIPPNFPVIFLESPHRIEGTLELLLEIFPQRRLSLAKEISKISEAFHEGTPQDLLTKFASFKGEWIGCLWPC